MPFVPDTFVFPVPDTSFVFPIICYKRLVEQKPTSQVAQETFHSADEVEYYVQCFKRVQLCRDSGMPKEDIAQATGHSLSLVQEYMDLMDDLNSHHCPTRAERMVCNRMRCDCNLLTRIWLSGRELKVLFC